MLDGTMGWWVFLCLRKEIGNDTPNVNEFYPSTPVLYEQSSLTPEVQDKEGVFTGNCYTPTSELKKEITDLKEKKSHST